MPKIDLNPLQAGGSVDPTKPLDLVVKAGLMIASFALFFVLIGFGKEVGSVLDGNLRSLLGMQDTNNGNPILGEV